MSSLDEEIIYEEDEVVWAKIRGYPWWPAFIDKIDIQRGESMYTVFFFGDNTHAKLGPLKLRKFIDYYTTHYLTAKTNRKLMAAIHHAEEKLSQNDQNVQIFKQLRDSLKNYKEKPHLAHFSSNKSHPEDSDQQPKIPRLIKSKTSLGNKRKRRYESQSDEQQSHQENGSQDKQGLGFSRQVKRPWREITKRQHIQSNKEQIFEEQQSHGQDHQLIEEKAEVKQERKQNLQKEQERIKDYSFEEQQSEEDDAGIFDEKEEQFGTKKKRGTGRIKQQIPRRRGRPRKNPSLKDEILRLPIKADKRKLIKKPSLELSFSPTRNLKAKISDDEIIEKVKSLLDSREELIDYLDTIKITPSNAKDILDLDVSNILQNGQMDYKVRSLLNLLKSSLLLKYFPDDTKNMRHYQKLARGKSTYSEPLKQEKSKEQSDFEFSSMDIRKKTIIKLEKFLKTHQEVDSNAKELAVKIESYFQKADNQIGKRYRTIAYKVLNNLKDKKETFREVMTKLDTNAYD